MGHSDNQSYTQVHSYMHVTVKTDTVIVIINGVQRSLTRALPIADKIIEAARFYQTLTDAQQRAKVVDDVLSLIDPAKRLTHSADSRLQWGENERLYLVGTQDDQFIDETLAKVMLTYLDKGIDINPMINLWVGILLNPTKALRTTIYRFLENGWDKGIQLTPDGAILAYKSVRVSYTGNEGKFRVVVGTNEDGSNVEQTLVNDLVFEPYHSGKYGMSISIGAAVEQPRDTCDSDPSSTCVSGLHVGGWGYVAGASYSSAGFVFSDEKNSGKRASPTEINTGDQAILQVLVFPEDIIAVPPDYSGSKMRVCCYYPVTVLSHKAEEPIVPWEAYADCYPAIHGRLLEIRQNRKKIISEFTAE
jgi:hypothetical protein